MYYYALSADNSKLPKSGLPPKLLGILGPSGNSWNLLGFERELLTLQEISWNFLISVFQRFVLVSFTADAM